MRFSQEFLDELKARLPVSEVVGRRVKLKKAGREWKGLSPFQQEKSPSFTVNDQKGFYHDFSSGKHGSIFDFVMETEGVPFGEAVERLASMAGMPLPQVSPEAERREQRRKTLHDIMELAATFFADTLAARQGARARGYLADRSLDPSTQLKFRIGYATHERFALKEHLGKAGVPVEDMIEAGLLVTGDDVPVPYDRFRDRVMFPITDARGRVIAFGGRALEKDVPAKYLNSPETPLFHKGDNLYNLAAARLAAHNGATPVVVEGYVDVIAMVGAGFEAAVAPLGTALTENQLALLWRMADEPILCFDGDKAGQKAAFRAADLALPHLQAGKKPALRAAAGRPGPRRSRALRRPRRHRRGRCGGPAARRNPVVARDRRRRVRDAGAARGAGAPHRRTRAKHPRRCRAQILSRRILPIGWRACSSRRSVIRAATQQRQGGGFRQDRSGAGGSAAAASAVSAGRARIGTAGAAMSGGGPYQVASPQLATSPILRGQRATMSRREALILKSLLNHPWLLHDHVEEVAALDLTHPDAQKLREAHHRGVLRRPSPFR